MSGLRLCSKMTQQPYYIEQLDINIYSIEEMAYYLYNNVYLVDRSFFNTNLINYIRNECVMPELAGRIEKGLKFGETYAGLVMMVAEASGYYDREELDELEYILDKIGNKPVDERMALRAEIFMKKGKYSKAQEIYKKLMVKYSRHINMEIMPRVWKNLGVISVKRFDYKEAVRCFEMSLELAEDEDALEKLVMAHILGGNPDKASMAAQKGGMTDEKLERIRIRINEMRDEIRADGGYRKLSEQLHYDGSQELEEFYAGVRKIVNRWKEEYREEMA